LTAGISLLLACSHCKLIGKLLLLASQFGCHLLGGADPLGLLWGQKGAHLAGQFAKLIAGP
jgi:hypothetical protein